ncbi:hypothetical protein ABKN59_007339 [Abortiporus biennis]
MTYSDNYSNYSNNRYPYFEQYPKSYTHSNHIQQPVPVKVEVNDSPNLHTSSSHHYHQHQQSLAQFSHKPVLPVYRFTDPGAGHISSPSPSASSTSFPFMSSHPWPSSTSASNAGSSYQHQQHHHHHQPYASDRLHGYPLPASMNGHSQSHAQNMSMNDEYEDADDDALGDLPPSSLGMGMGYGGSGFAGSDSGTQGSSKEKTVRRRSSKACDQCRKSKCKCERSNPQEPCRNCVMLGTPCTFLGPSRKRGPPKGYIDAIEARLHQTEALIGILLSSKDNRAKTLLEDLSLDPLAKDIINRVNNSPYGYKGRNRGSEAPSNRPRPPASEPKESEGISSQPTHPSNEWQDLVTEKLNSVAVERHTALAENEHVYGADDGDIVATSTNETSGQPPSPSDDEEPRPGSAPGTKHSSDTNNGRPSLSLQPVSGAAGPASAPAISQTSRTTESEPGHESGRRQRRRLEGEQNQGEVGNRSPSTASISGRSRSPMHYALLPPHPVVLSARSSLASLRIAQSINGEEEVEGEDELAIAVGQLSMNEDDQVRYHGKASGLHLLMGEREDGRHEGGIWRFPKSRVWPPLPATANTPTKSEEDWATLLPDPSEQEHLLELYFTYVHPSLPILHKQAFMDSYRYTYKQASTPTSPDPQSPSPSRPRDPKRRRVPVLLLLSMFSIAARYSSASSVNVPSPEEGSISYSQSRPTTCQALLLLGYREVGIGSMSQAWLYIGMAVRMAQDLGMHKNADKWTNVGKNLFTPDELQERRRIWYGCVVMDNLDEVEELESWAPHPSAPLLESADEPHPRTMSPVTGHVLSSFNEFSKLSIILSMIMQTMYPIRPHLFRLTEFSRLEKLLDTWYYQLPDHLCFDPASPKQTNLPPHTHVLHLHYWCTVILLHRPFIRNLSDAMSRPPLSPSKDAEALANPRRNYDICVQAANNITSIVSVYVENHCIRRASVFLCYYIFTAAIMHVATLTMYPSDPQASIGLHKCMDALHLMQNVWPSAWRAYQLLHGSKVQPTPTPSRTSMSPPSSQSERHKRTAEHALDEPSSTTSRLPAEPLYRIDIPSNDTPSFYPSFDRWAPENALGNFSGSLPTSSLSTSVLPQQYSTGLMDERSHRGQERSTQRYPQYWNDYSSMGQMEATYAVPVVGDMVPPNTSSRTSQSTGYGQDYTVFNNMPGSQ